MAKKRARVNTDFVGRSCEICLREYGEGRGKVNLVRHHVTYEPEEIMILCYSCHWWVHGTRQIWNHPFIREYGKDEGANMFHVKYAQLVEEYTGSEV